MRTSIAIVGSVAIAFAVWVLWRGDPPTLPPDPGAAGPIDKGSPVTLSARAGTADAPEREAVPEATHTDPTAGPSTTSTIVVRGRCVDADGEALAGVEARLTATRNYRSKGNWPTVPPQTTSRDGVFAFRIEPRKHWEFGLSLVAAGRAKVRGGWSGLEQNKQLGDVTIPKGCVIHGRVVDSRGEPQPDVWFAFADEPSPDSIEIGPSPYHRTKTGADGGYRFAPTLAGSKRLWISDAILRSPTELVVPVAVEERFVEVVVECVDDWPSIRGVVVDDQGLPLEGVQLDADPRLDGFNIRRTPESGSFTVMQPAKGPTGPVRLHAFKLGFADLATTSRYAWGTKDLRLTMARVSGVKLRVTDGSRAIEAYSVWIAAAPGTSRARTLNYDRIRNRGHHPDGETVVQGLQDGDFVLVVLPDDPVWLDSDFTRVRLGTGPAPHLNIELRRPAHRGALVRWSGGAPIAGAKIALLETFGDTVVTPQTHTYARGTLPLEGLAYLRAIVMTDQRGEARLRGPSRGELALRVSGSAFATVVRRGVSLADVGADPILIEIERPATISGRVRPQKLLSQLDALANGASVRPGLYLRRDRAGKRETIPTGVDRSVPIDSQGGFTFDAVPPGSWDIVLRYVRRTGTWDLMTSGIAAGRVRDLAKGEDRRHDLDLSHLVFASVELTLYVDDKLQPGKSLYLDGTIDGVNLTADGQGRFAGQVPPGRYKAVAQLDGISIPAAGELEISPGQHLVRTLHARTQPVVLHVVGRDGVRRGGVRLYVGQKHLGQHRSRHRLPPTDGDRDRRLRLPLGEVVVWAMPKGVDGGSNKHVQIAEIEVRTGEEPQRVRIELSDSLGY